ncbi:MAG: 3-deoxy-manno-octulosonate cytidylyltransferase [Rhodospirillales bacterium]|jgi:3-deoxy-manno-octulosonate cytidylyltransferase (CMP-KDO synthetase)|nr:3-deoxy-manno-octulosonate cytidylyltransferase [Rhodospirillales bacterium]HIJ44426.1 3-deoxy-manno-octulosonate cytidylyltransferase [Rhodospirillaceae bacterium]MDP7216132.1 3-deoxy-manno-octulosonate cytidylyltransferase [Rhodospirillales bacterium]HIJ44984.1 3-deoxy-manno-octulosonate cytidylyltransferase [Rhodospirillaceae bacterium]HIJ93263.1 3-deoxy-manno-octulosonate cytidylyltransferase [Rhodospirillaceae bacterium]
MALPRNPIVVIPARMASNRLPGKPLAEIGGEPMIVHVWRRAVEADLGPVLVAAAETEIAEAVKAAGGDALLTRSGHPSGSDRVFEAVEAVDPDGRHDAVVNMQGDLPTIEADIAGAVLGPLAEAEVDIATLASAIGGEAEKTNPNVVKAVISLQPGETVGRALYFSRAPVPCGEGPLYHHIGLYAFRRRALARFAGLPRGGLERRERLEQLRALENGMRIDAALVDRVPFAVDTPADLARGRELLARGS